MKRGIYILVTIALLIGLTSAFGCSAGEETMKGNTPETENLSTAVKMNGKELTVGAPTLAANVGATYLVAVTVVVKNPGHEPITLAELELVHTEPDGCGVPEWGKNWMHGRSPIIVVKDLAPDQVQTLCWLIDGYGLHGGLNIRVRRLE